MWRPSTIHKPMLHARLLGAFTVQQNGQLVTLPSQASRSLLAFLLYHDDALHTRSRLCGLLWPDAPERTARRRLSHALWEVDNALTRPDAPSPLRRDSDLIGMDPDAPRRVDAHDFTAACTAADGAAWPAAARHHLHQAVQLYQGDLLAGLYDDWIIVEQERLRERYLHALGRLVQADKAAGAYEQALQHNLTLLAADPLNEEHYREAMRLYHHLGRPHEAERIYAQCCRILERELGVEPDAATRALAVQDSATPPAEAVSSSPARPLLTGARSPMVGRDRERADLLVDLEAALAGDGGIVLVEGEAGVGKSRLLETLAEDAQWRGAAALVGRADNPAAETPYRPLVTALQTGLTPLRVSQLARLLDPLWLSVAGQLLPALPAHLPAHLPDHQQPAELHGDQERIRLLESLVRVILALGQITPLVLILEDLHWADDATFDALAYLARRLPGTPILLVAGYRRRELQERPAPWERTQAMDRGGVRRRLVLARLDLRETGLLIRRALGLQHDAPLFFARIHQETGGNPLFVLETLRGLRQEGALTQDDDGNWTTPYDAATDDYAELPLAPAVEEVIARRLGRLDDQSRRVLEEAAVLGNEVDLALLTQVSDLADWALLAGLGALVQQGFLDETPTAYRFSHDLVRQTVYAHLPPRRQRALHSRAAAVLATSSPDQVTALAYHFELSDAPDRAAPYLLQAGQDAAALHLYPQALESLDRAAYLAERGTDAPSLMAALLAERERILELVGDRVRQRADLERLQTLTTHAADARRLQRRYGELLCAVDDYVAAQEQLTAALETARRQNDRREEAALLAALGQAVYWSGDPAGALPTLEDAMELAQALHAKEIEADALLTVAGCHNDLSNHQACIDASERAIAIFQELGNRVEEANALATLGAVAMEQGRLDDADANFGRALPVAQTSGYRYGEARTLVNWGAVSFLRGRIGQALEQFRSGAEIFGQIDSLRGKRYTDLNLAAALSTYVGQDPDAEAAVVQALDHFRERDEGSTIAQSVGILGQFHCLRGELAAALACLREAVEQATRGADPWVTAQSLQERALVHLQLETPQAALEDAREGLALVDRYGFDDLRPLLLAAQARALLDLGQATQAQQVSAGAVAALKPTTYRAHQIYFTHFQILLAGGFTADAVAALEQAHAALQQILGSLSERDRARSEQEIPVHRAILAAWQNHKPVVRTVRLPRADAPTGRPLEEDELVTVNWIVECAADRAIAARGARRRAQILRLLRQAQEQDAAPAYHHLAQVLAVSERTIKRDMVALRARVAHLPPTRGDGE